MGRDCIREDSLKLFAYIDGSSLGNPGEAGYGVIIKDETDQVLKGRGQYIGKATNNVAEYQGLLGCLELMEAYTISHLVVFSDSQLLVRQIHGTYRVKQPHLQVLHKKVLDTIRSADYHFEIRHIPRQRNEEADRLARQSVMIRSTINT
jgi:ribonuclease HI